jgi:voltage-gated potassium channel Kch
MTPWKRILSNLARFRPAGFAQLNLFLGIILLATPLRQERWLFWVLLQFMFLDALLVSLSAGDTQQRLRRAFWGVWTAGFVANLGATLASSVESARWWNIATLSLAFVLLSGCTVVVLAYIFRSQRVTLEVILAAVTVYLLIAFSFATIYNIAFQFDFRSFRFPDWIEAGSAEVLRTEMIYFSLVTLATLGYGDILPSSPFTQMLAVLEAVIGQFFMAVLVAWLVGMFIYDNFAGKQ